MQSATVVKINGPPPHQGSAKVYTISIEDNKFYISIDMYKNHTIWYESSTLKKHLQWFNDEFWIFTNEKWLSETELANAPDLKEDYLKLLERKNLCTLALLEI